MVLEQLGAAIVTGLDQYLIFFLIGSGFTLILKIWDIFDIFHLSALTVGAYFT